MNKKLHFVMLLMASIGFSQAFAGLIDEETHVVRSNDSLVARADDRTQRGKTGLQGIPGPKGDQGHPGLRGEKGEKGERGSNGKKGEKGDKGDRGSAGKEGPKGEKGERGSNGKKGEKGERGEKGSKGDKGERGIKGERGEKGEAGPKGEKGASDFAHALSSDLFVDGCTQVAKAHQDGSLARPFATIEQAIDKAKQQDPCHGNGHCKIVTILIASGFYNCPDEECTSLSSSSSSSCTSSSSSSSSSEQECGCDITIIGNQKLALIALGPVTLGCTDDCGCQPTACNRPVGITWVPVGGSCQGGIRPTLSISSLNGLAEAMTPYQSYSNKFRITGGITIINKNCCECNEEDLGCIAICNEPISLSTSTSTSTSNCDASFSRSHSDSVTFGANNSISKKHHQHKRKRDSSSERFESSSDRLHVSSEGSKHWHHSQKKGRISGHGTYRRLHKEESGEISSTGDIARVHHSTSYEVITKHGHRHSCSTSHTSYTTVSSEFDCPTECVMCDNDGELDCPGACQVANLCCTEDCLPAELSFNGELFGDLSVTGRAMLYFNRSRVHGFVNAPNSDIVVAERARFDELVTINFYGTIQNSEFLDGITFTGCELLDPCCVSVFLQGFFTTFISGPVTGNPGCGEGGSPFIIDITTSSILECNISTDCASMEDVCLAIYTQSTCPLGNCGL